MRARAIAAGFDWLCWLVVLAVGTVGCAGGSERARDCDPACGAGTVCRYGACVPPPSPCAQNLDCPGDRYCDPGTGGCLPWDVGPGGSSDPACQRAPVPGVLSPVTQCAWLGPPAGDPYPAHVNVLATPAVATFFGQGALAAPSIVFPSYNYIDRALESCAGIAPTSYYGVIRIIDGRDCTQQATLSAPPVIATAPVAIADLGGDPTPEIVAARMDGGLVAFTLQSTGWQVMWQTPSRLADDMCDWAGPSIHDLDDDGVPEIVFYGAVYDAAGRMLDESIATVVDSVGVGYIPVVADLDGDGRAELISGKQIYTWDPGLRRWAPAQALPVANGHVAVADFGTFPQSGPDLRGVRDGIPEVVVVYAGVVRVLNRYGREVFAASLQGLGGQVGNGGPPAIADFDGDGRAEIATAGASAYHVLDPDCRGTPDPASCPSMRTDGVAWLAPSRDSAVGTSGTAAFDFDGDGRAEAIYGDECFERIYDGRTGAVLASRARTSCTRAELPVVADTDGDLDAELVVTSNASCGAACPAVDPLFDGLACLGDADCPAALRCGRAQATDPLGRCRCTSDLECGGDGLVCVDPIGGSSPAGRVCRASHPAGSSTGVRVLADRLDRWTSARAIWNQHAYSVTNIDPAARVPRTSQWAQNWTQAGLDSFRQNTFADGLSPGAVPDLTLKQAEVTCEPGGGATIAALVCNRGTEPVPPGLPVSAYAVGAPGAARCTAATAERLAPGGCAEVRCRWTGGPAEGYLAADDRGDHTGTSLECREDNNQLALSVACP